MKAKKNIQRRKKTEHQKMTKIKFLVADCGHIIRADNLGGKCSRCGRLCCKDCLTIINDCMLCPTCLKEVLKD